MSDEVKAKLGELNEEYTKLCTEYGNLENLVRLHLQRQKFIMQRFVELEELAKGAKDETSIS